MRLSGAIEAPIYRLFTLLVATLLVSRARRVATSRSDDARFAASSSLSAALLRQRSHQRADDRLRRRSNHGDARHQAAVQVSRPFACRRRQAAVRVCSGNLYVRGYFHVSRAGGTEQSLCLNVRRKKQFACLWPIIFVKATPTIVRWRKRSYVDKKTKMRF